ncbi:MAG: hypothetical protein ACD_29C00213G0003 [uncultured bacterium]|nr:MAG: hypothetical protein ACD_29C00213G0003 [uncultured bacterium]
MANNNMTTTLFQPVSDQAAAKELSNAAKSFTSDLLQVLERVGIQPKIPEAPRGP